MDFENEHEDERRENIPEQNPQPQSDHAAGELTEPNPATPTETSADYFAEAASRIHDDFQSTSGTGQPESIQTESPPAGQRPPKTKKTGLVVLVALCVLALAAGIVNFISAGPSKFFPVPSNDLFTFFLSDSDGKFFSGKSDSGISNSDHVAVLHIEGTIQEANETYNQEWLISTIDDLTYSKKNKGILLYIDSPGGGVYESDEVYLKLLDYKDISGKPVWAYLGPMAASGGYYIACAADYIIANRNCLTGSIGVVAGQSVDFSQFLEEHGIKVNTFYAGRNKDMLGLSSPVTPEQAAIMQSLADECYIQFVAIVADSRGMEFEAAEELADGRIYSARQALKHDLIDKVARFEEACTYFEDALREGELNFSHYYPENEQMFLDYLFTNIRSALSGGTAAGTTETFLQAAREQVMPDISYPAYYYHQ